MTILDVPETVVLDDESLVVTAQVENPTEEIVTESVELRINGTVVAEQQATVGPSEADEVQFQLDKANLEPGRVFVDVLTRNFGQSTIVTVTEPETTPEPAETTETPVAEQESLRVANLDAPDQFTLDDEPLVVSAEFRNPTDETVTETVTLRVDGTVVAERQVEVAPGETTTVEFDVPTQELDPGLAIIEVHTREFGVATEVSVEEESSA